MLRVAMISPLPPQKAGEASYTTNLIENLVAHYKVEIHAIGGLSASPVLPNNERVTTYPIWEGQKLSYIPKMLQLLKNLRPHILHVQFGPHGMVYGGMFGEYMLMLLLLAKNIGIKTTVTLHSTWMPEQVKQRVEQYRLLRVFSNVAPPLFRFYNRVLDWATNTIQLSTSRTKSKLRRFFLNSYKIDSNKVLEIPHPCDQQRQESSNRNTLRNCDLKNRAIILVFGFMRRGKGIKTAIKAMKELILAPSDPILVIAGSAQDKDGERYLQELRQYAHMIGVEDSIRFISKYIPDKEVPHLFRAASAVVIPYSESVGASGPLHDYAAYGTPMIVSDVGLHMRDALGGNALLFERGNARDLAEKLDLILSDKACADEVSKRQKQYAEKETWKLAAKRTMHHYWTTLMR